MRTERNFYEYKSENGKTYRLEMDNSNAVSVGNVPAFASIQPDYPQRWEPRYLWAEVLLLGNSNGGISRLLRRKIYVGDIANPKWLAGGVLDLDVMATLNGYTNVVQGPNGLKATFMITGCVGERREQPVT